MIRIIQVMLLSLVATTFLGSVYASEKEDYYVSFGGATISDDFLDYQVAYATLGQNFTENFAIETLLGTGVAGDEITISGVRVEADINSILGVYGIVKVATSDISTVYGKIGFTRVDLSASASGFTVIGSDTYLTYGLGLDMRVSKNSSIGFEYSSYEGDAESFGLSYKFSF